MYKLAHHTVLEKVFRDEPKKAISFDEELLSCPLMLNNNISARLYPHSDCSMEISDFFWWYQGNLFNEK
jgi:hypothetical protein